MTGKFDQPLGIPGSGSQNRSNFTRFAIFGLLAVSIATLGIAVTYLIKPEPQISTQNNDPIATLPVSQSKQFEITKRPDLAIDENGPGLTELNASGELEVPTIVPRKRPENIEKRQILVHLPDAELIEETSFGKLPTTSADGLRPLDVYSRQADTEGNFGVARIVIIVGGLGISQTSTLQAIKTLPAGVTLALAPYGNSLNRWMQMARKDGHELLMQIPMEPFGYPQTNAGERSLLSSANNTQNENNLHWTLGRVTNYVGVMNYLGGKFLTSPQKLTSIFEELSARGLMFVDDGSIRNSMAIKLAKSTATPFTKAHMTIDSLRTRVAIGEKLKELEAMAKRSGLAIGVATAFPESINLIGKFLKNAKSRGLELTPVSAIVFEPPR